MGVTTLVATVVSEPHPQKGQKHRSSNNFTFDFPACQPYRLIWQIEDQPGYDWRQIVFDIMQDKSGKDPVLMSGMSSGIWTEVFGEDKKLYVANPRRANKEGNLPSDYSSFTLKIYAEADC